MQDLVSTPHDRFFSGVEVQATIADDLLQGDFARRPELAIVAELLLVLGMCAVVAIVIGRLGVLAGVLAAVAAAGVLVAGLAWLLHGTGLVLSPVLPLVGTGVGLAAATIATLAGERRAAIAGLQGARRETERAAHVKDEFLMTVSHELRTPLTAIYGYAQMLAKGALKDEQRSRAIATIERNARAQTQLIDDLLDASQVLAGRLRLDMAGVDLGALVQSVADALQPAIDAKRLALGVKLAPLEPIPGDPDRLRQVVWHLLSNAIKFTPEGGRVDVRLERSGAHALLTVSDTGIGIAPEFIPVMFDQFRQEDASTKRTFGGLGIGLTLVRYVVELHGGTVRATSQGPGHGAVLSVRLPLEAMAPAVSMANMVKSGSIRLDGVRVLVVDDQVEARTLAGATLLNAGARPVTAANPADALAIFASSEVDVIVVSLDMPEDGGYRIADEAVAINAGRDAQLRPDVQIVAMCANPSSGDARAALAPIALRIAKPIDPVQLVSVIAALTHREIRSTNGGQA
jgi:signal transduction histidine kinase/CheY-like chemotaxis protein